MAKYIIDIASPNVRNKYIVYWTYDGLEAKRVSDLTPYTEPDLEQVRKEAYKDGYDAGFGRKIDASYQEGLSDAWEAVKKLARMDTDTSESITGYFGLHNIMHNLTASEAIEKIRQYEQEKEEQITKGDVIRIKSTPEIEILVTYADEEYVSGIALTEVDDNCEIGDQYTNIRICNVEKTGRHYEIEEVLRKMKETDNG